MIIFMTDGILFLKYASKRRLEFPQQADNKKKMFNIQFFNHQFRWSFMFIARDGILNFAFVCVNPIMRSENLSSCQLCWFFQTCWRMRKDGYVIVSSKTNEVYKTHIRYLCSINMSTKKFPAINPESHGHAPYTASLCLLCSLKKNSTPSRRLKIIS